MDTWLVTYIDKNGVQQQGTLQARDESEAGPHAVEMVGENTIISVIKQPDPALVSGIAKLVDLGLTPDEVTAVVSGN